MRNSDETEMSVARERKKEREKERVSRRQYKGAIKSRRPTIQADLAHRLHLIFSAFSASLSPSSIPPASGDVQPRSILFAVCSGYGIDWQLQCESFEISTLREAQRWSLLGNRGLHRSSIARKFEKKKAQPLSQQLRIVFAKQIYIRSVAKTIKTKRLTIPEESNKKREINELDEKFAYV